MKLPSLNYLFFNGKKSLLRFPLTIASALIATVFGIYLIEKNRDLAHMFPFINIMLCAGVGIPLFFCVTVISDKKNVDSKNRIIINLLATMILVGLYFTLPNSESTHNTSLPYIKYALYNLTCHLLVSFIPFIFSRQLNAFWHYNKILFVRILASILYSGFIYVGLIIALAALNLLFDIKIHEELYFEVWITTMCFFNTWFFVAGIPSDFDALDTIHEYPKGLKIFSQYVLLPLLGLYLIILYAYGAKICALWDWPRGIVSYLIVCISVLGILTFLLLHPYGSISENGWIKKASRGYYFLLFPLLIMLFVAIFMRTNDYGITINRYVIFTLGIWLSIVCLYTAFGKTNIKFIPTSLAIICVLSSFGPWSMFSISEKSQVNRLKIILEKSNILVGNKIENEPIWIRDSLPKLYSHSELKNEGRINDSLHNEVMSILKYLDEHHGFSSVREWYKQNVDSIVGLQDALKDKWYGYTEAELYMKTLGLKYEKIYTDNRKSLLNYNSGYNASIKKVKGFDYLVNFNIYNYGTRDNTFHTFEIDSLEYKLVYSNKPSVRLLLHSKTDSIYFSFDDLLKKLKKEYGNNPEVAVPVTKMQLLGANNSFEIKLEFLSIAMELEKDSLRLNNLSGDIFIKKLAKN